MIDSHTHMTPDGIWPFNDRKADPEALISALDKAGIAKAIILPIAGKDDDEWTMKVAAKSGGRLISYLSVDPLNESPKERIEKIHKHKARGLKLHPRFQKIKLNDQRVVEYFIAITREYKGTLLIDAFYPDNEPDETIEELKSFIASIKDIRIILAHAGGFRFKEVIPLTKQPHVYIDTSFTFNVFEKHKKDKLSEELAAMLKEVPKEKILFGSDFPEYSIADSKQLAKRMLEAAGFDEERLTAFFEKNITALLEREP